MSKIPASQEEHLGVLVTDGCAATNNAKAPHGQDPSQKYMPYRTEHNIPHLKFSVKLLFWSCLFSNTIGPEQHKFELCRPILCGF